MKNKNLREFLGEDYYLSYSADLSAMSKVVDQSQAEIISAALANETIYDCVTFKQFNNGVARVDPYMYQVWDVTSATCSTFADGATTSFAPILLNGVYKKFNTSICWDDMAQYWGGYQDSRGDANNNDLPSEFVSEFTSFSLRNIVKKLSALACVDLTADAEAVVGHGTASYSSSVSTSASNGVIKTLDDMLANLSGDFMDQDDLFILCNYQFFNSYIQSIRNLFHGYGNVDNIFNTGVYLFHAPNIKLIPQAGMSGINKAILYSKKFAYIGGDVDPRNKVFTITQDPYQPSRYLFFYNAIYDTAMAPVGNGVVVAS